MMFRIVRVPEHAIVSYWAVPRGFLNAVFFLFGGSKLSRTGFRSIAEAKSAITAYNRNRCVDRVRYVTWADEEFERNRSASLKKAMGEDADGGGNAVERPANARKKNAAKKHTRKKAGKAVKSAVVEVKPKREPKAKATPQSQKFRMAMAKQSERMAWVQKRTAEIIAEEGVSRSLALRRAHKAAKNIRFGEREAGPRKKENFERIPGWKTRGTDAVAMKPGRKKSMPEEAEDAEATPGLCVLCNTANAEPGSDTCHECGKSLRERV